MFTFGFSMLNTEIHFEGIGQLRFLELTWEPYHLIHAFSESRTAHQLYWLSETSMSSGMTKKQGIGGRRERAETGMHPDYLTEVSKGLESLDHTGRRRVVLGHTLNTRT